MRSHALEEAMSLLENRYNLPVPLRRFQVVSVVLSLLSIGFVVWMHLAHPGAGHGLPPLMANEWYTDMLATRQILPYVHDARFFDPRVGWIYPAPCVFLYELLLRPGMVLGHVHGMAMVTYLAMVGVGVAVAVRLMYGAMVRAGLRRGEAVGFLATSVGLSYPLWFSVHQGNVEAILAMGMMGCGYLIYKERWMAAGAAIGFVASFKLYPILLLGILLTRKKYKAMGLSLAIFAAMNLVAMQYIGPDIATVWHRLAPGLASFKELGFYPGRVDRDYLCFDHALIALVRVLTQDNARLMQVLGRLWVPCFGVAGAVAYLWHVRKQPLTNQVLFLVLAMVLLPPKSYDYTLIALYLPWCPMVLLAIESARAGERVRGVWLMLPVMAVAMSATMFVKLGSVYYFGQVTTVVLLVLLWMNWRYPLELRAPPAAA